MRQGASGEVMMLRAARRYDITTDTVVFANGLPFSRDNLRTAGLHEYADGMFNFCHGMGRIGVDNAEFALLTAICIFSGQSHCHLCCDCGHLRTFADIYVAIADICPVFA